MKYIELQQNLKDFRVFSLADIRLVDARFHRRRLNNWQEKGYIKKIVRGFYFFSDVARDEYLMFEIANKIYAPSYVSFEAALAYHHLIPESVYAVTSATSRLTHTFHTDVGTFVYRKLAPRFFFGYDLMEFSGRRLCLASPEKALLDYLYLHSSIKISADFASLRLSRDIFHKVINAKTWDVFVARFGLKSLGKRAHNLLEYMEHA